MSPERELVIALCRTPLSVAARHRVSSLLAGRLDWESVFRHAAHWEVEPVVFSNLRSLHSEVIPATVLTDAAVRERESRAAAITRTLVLVDLARRLKRIGIDALVLKGPAVGIAAYGDASMRTFADIDFLVRRNDLIPARQLLLSLGYSPEYDPADEAALIRDQHALEFSGSHGKVELHWSLLSRHLRLDTDLDELWSSAQSVSCAGSMMRVIAPHHLFLFLCAHGAKHEWERVRWICDVAQLADRLERHEIAAVLHAAGAAHARRILALGLRVAGELFGEPLLGFPGDALVPERDTLPLQRIVRRRIGVVAAPESPEGDWLTRLDPGLRPLVFWVRARERWRDRIACIARVLLVPTKKDAGVGILRWVGRPIRLAARAVRRAASRSRGRSPPGGLARS